VSAGPRGISTFGDVTVNGKQNRVFKILGAEIEKRMQDVVAVFRMK
jgi:hypothetical protein